MIDTPSKYRPTISKLCQTFNIKTQREKYKIIAKLEEEKQQQSFYLNLAFP